MTRDEIYTRVRDLLAKRFEIDPARVTLEARLFQDLDLDSIDAIDMAVELQTWTGRRLPEESLRSIRTIADVISTIETHLATGGDSGAAGG
jgi:acyl carrier protein